MSNKETLKRAINKALENGWSGNYYYALTIADTFPDGSMTKQVIFDHDFAKALWGESGFTKNMKAVNGILSPIDSTKEAVALTTPAWKYHLQQMVVADDPIQYLGDNI